MARMDHNPKQRISFGCPEDHVDILDEIAGEDTSRSELLRELVAEKVDEYRDDSAEDIYTPDDPMLEEAYRTLLDAADERISGAGLRLTIEEAKNALYDNRTPKDAVMTKYIRPLRPEFVDIDRDMATVWVTVRPPTPVEQSPDTAASTEVAPADD